MVRNRIPPKGGSSTAPPLTLPVVEAKPADPPHCGNCRFWLESKTFAGEGGCHYGPPVALNPIGRPQGLWLLTGREDWCGQHKPATEGSNS